MSAKRSEYSRRMESLLASTGTRGVRESGAWHERILGGLEFAAAERVKAEASLTDSELAKLLGIGEATLRRARAAGGTLDTATSDRLYRLTKVLSVAEEALEGSANAGSWLRRAQPALGGRVPLELLVTQAGADEVETLLRRIDYGIYT
jgi:putative toxin-antitoxin system antitoxin component (TIGR02293 family)